MLKQWTLGNTRQKRHNDTVKAETICQRKNKDNKSKQISREINKVENREKYILKKPYTHEYFLKKKW